MATDTDDIRMLYGVTADHPAIKGLNSFEKELVLRNVAAAFKIADGRLDKNEFVNLQVYTVKKVAKAAKREQQVKYSVMTVVFGLICAV